MKQLIPYRLWIYFAIIILFGILITFYYYQVQPVLVDNKLKEERLQQLKVELNELNQDRDQSNPLPESVLIDLARSLPVAPTIQQLIKDLEIIEEKTGTSISLVNFQENDSSESVSSWIENLFENQPKVSVSQRLNGVELASIQFNIELEGTRQAILDFITALVEQERIITVDRIYYYGELTNDLEELQKDETLIGSSIQVTAYYIPEFAPYLQEHLSLGKDNAVKLKDLYKD